MTQLEPLFNLIPPKIKTIIPYWIILSFAIYAILTIVYPPFLKYELSKQLIFALGISVLWSSTMLFFYGFIYNENTMNHEQTLSAILFISLIIMLTTLVTCFQLKENYLYTLGGYYIVAFLILYIKCRYFSKEKTKTQSSTAKPQPLPTSEAQP